MPISQDRMLALITAGKDYQQALQTACKMVKIAYEMGSSNPSTALAELTRLSSLIFESGLLKQPLSSHSLLLLEEQHFKKESWRNTSRRDKIRAKRGTGEYPKKKSTSPTVIFAPEELRGESQSEAIAPKLAALDDSGLLAQKFSGLSAEEKAQIEREAEQALAAEAFGKKSLFDQEDD